MKKRKKILSLFGAALAGGIVFAGTCTLQAEEAQTIAEGVTIGSVDVGGMTYEEAEAAIDSYISQIGESQITLAAGERSISVKASELGIHAADEMVVQEAVDVGRSGNLIKRFKDKKDLERGGKTLALEFDADRAAVETLLGDNAGELNQEAVDNGLVRENGAFRIVKGAQGIAVNTGDSAAVIESYIRDAWDGSAAEIELVAEIVEPRGSEEELSQITDLLGSYNTNYSSSNSNRCHNIANAAGMINGTLLYPGEEFSVNATIGPLDKGNGYELAGSYENGQVVDSYGGGVCQVSTTLYNAVILAELEVTERSNHSMIVTYVKPSMDAAIAGDYKDLKFVNNQELPIYIESYTEGKNIYFNIFGRETRPSNRVISYESEVVSTQDPGIQFVATGDPVGYLSVAQGKHTGYVAQLWKVVTVDGAVESREIFNKSSYKASPKIVKVGTASEDPNISAIVGAAIASGDEGTVYAAVSPYAANASAIMNPAAALSPEEQAAAAAAAAAAAESAAVEQPAEQPAQ